MANFSNIIKIATKFIKNKPLENQKNLKELKNFDWKMLMLTKLKGMIFRSGTTVPTFIIIQYVQHLVGNETFLPTNFPIREQPRKDSSWTGLKWTLDKKADYNAKKTIKTKCYTSSNYNKYFNWNSCLIKVCTWSTYLNWK